MEKAAFKKGGFSFFSWNKNNPYKKGDITCADNATDFSYYPATALIFNSLCVHTQQGSSEK